MAQRATKKRSAPLRAVGADEKAPKPRKPRRKTLVQAVEAGDYLETLLTTQRAIAADLPSANGPAKAALYRQLLLVTKDIEAIRQEKSEAVGEDELPDDEPWDASAI